MKPEILTLWLETSSWADYRKRTKKIIQATGQWIDAREPKTLDGYPYRYSIRGGRHNDCGEFATLEKDVVVNFCGHFFTTEPIVDIQLHGDWMPIDDWDFSGTN